MVVFRGIIVIIDGEDATFTGNGTDDVGYGVMDGRNSLP
jgi:hypothetical protein